MTPQRTSIRELDSRASGGSPVGTRSLAVASSVLLLSLGASASHAQPAPAAYLTFDEGTGNTAADSSGNGHTATLSGAAGWSAGLVGPSGLAVTGAGASIAEIPVPVVDTAGSFTVAAWVKLNSSTGYQTFVSEDGPVLSSFFLQLRGDTRQFSFTVPYDFFVLPQSGFTPVLGRWYHLAGVYDAAARSASLYVDGAIVDTVYNVVSSGATGPTAIGRGKFAGNPVDFVNGAIDDVRLYQAALTAPEILAIAKVGDPTLTGPLPVEPATLRIDAANPGPDVSPILSGLMIEEINHSLDGGLYAELIQNRVFKDDDTSPVHWALVQDGGAPGAMALDTTQPIAGTALTTSLRITAGSTGPRVGVANDGYGGIPIRSRAAYRASFFARPDAGFDGPLEVSLESPDGTTVYARARVSRLATGWRKYELCLRTGKVTPTANARLVVSTRDAGTFWLNQVSLFPATYRDRPNGNRVDLMRLLSDLNPTFLRFPGGNFLEGNTIDERFQWKNTIGPIEARPGHRAPWNYRSTDGLGLLEYLLWCEDLGMMPVLGVYAGYSLNGSFVNPGPDLEPYVQDALDEIEYVTGDTDTFWGARRAADGHPDPFPLEYVEIGNEDFFDRSGSYEGRFAQFHDAIKAAHPELKLVATTSVASRTPDVIDEHFYATPRAFQRMADRYDGYDRSGPKIFVGEYASIEGRPTPDLNAALGDAAWLTGVERNSDVVIMAAYAPLFVNVLPGASQWPTNLIGYDALRSYGSPSYHVHKMFGAHTGDVLLRAALTATGGSRLFQSVTRDRWNGTIHVKVVNAAPEPQPVRIELDGVRSVSSRGRAIVLTSASPQDTNTLDHPTAVVPRTDRVRGLGRAFDFTFAPHSFTVLEIRAR
jgi:alpha-L-arabinofuranosidase